MKRNVTTLKLMGHPVEVSFEIEPAFELYPEDMYVLDIKIGGAWLDAGQILSNCAIDELNRQLPAALAAEDAFNRDYAALAADREFFREAA